MARYTPEILKQAKQMFKIQKAIQMHKILPKKISGLKYKKLSVPLEGIYEVAKVPKNVQKEIAASIAPIIKTFFNKPVPEFTAYRLGKGEYCMSLPEKKRYHIILDITEKWDEETGGMLIYQKPSGEAIEIPASQNTLSIIDSKGLRAFVTYANHYTGKNKRVLFTTSL
jgi:hypothetical protein